MIGQRETPNGRIRAAGYIRVSQERNVDRHGLDAQEIDVHRYIEYMQWELSEVYREEGVSGYKRERPALDRMLADAKTRRFDVAVFPSIDRIARSVKDTIAIEEKLRECGISVVFVREGIDTATPVGEFFRNVMSSIAEFEGHLIHERMLKGLRAKASQGGYTGTWLPYGYRAVDGEVVVAKKEATIVRRIFRWRASGKSLRWMAQKLNEDGVPTLHNKKWYPSTIWDLYRNRFYTGKSKFNDGWIEGQHEAIVPEELFRDSNAE
ncbi:MAG: recombinase family protein [Planctomycetota bacterium]|nr:MAG: recombinase family protein [Planctomycetota bacterium]